MVMQGAEEVKRRKMWIRLENGGGDLGKEWYEADPRRSIAYFSGRAQILSRSIDLEAENHEKQMIVYSNGQANDLSVSDRPPQ